ncbi:hypothetical protein M011DRAFT_478558 [Sporormia fimetaria CBS 119925]|uniref:Uncharacterized protein n=1 Tax=Sporormia fimetaria CBS 119925 TaxID=1340428 RepID=A0A6A6V9G4_9PLEO|nr:hypothetical protein M011DRAFT_478558 [Sporormia fimetaria CBS 119925]
MNSAAPPNPPAPRAAFPTKLPPSPMPSPHAHPPTSDANDEASVSARHKLHLAVAAMFDEFDIHVQLRGLQGENLTKVTDVYCPEVRRSPLAGTEVAKHMDVVYCWKGLSYKLASELAYWHTVFKECLEAILRRIIIEIFADRLRQDNEPVDRWAILPLLRDFLSYGNPRSVDISVPELVNDMITRLYDDELYTHHTWFVESRKLPAMLYNFLRTRDCFIANFPYPTLEVSFTPIQEALGFCIFGDVQWQLPVIRFYNMPTSLPTGGEYRIACQYVPPILDQSMETFQADPEFLVSSRRLPLAWDSNKECFRAIVPALEQNHEEGKSSGDYPTSRVDKMETAFSAKINIEFPGRVRFEVISRYNLVLQVTPQLSSEHLDLPASAASSLEKETTELFSSPETVSVHLSPRENYTPATDEAIPTRVLSQRQSRRSSMDFPADETLVLTEESFPRVLSGLSALPNKWSPKRALSGSGEQHRLEMASKRQRLTDCTEGHAPLQPEPGSGSENTLASDRRCATTILRKSVPGFPVHLHRHAEPPRTIVGHAGRVPCGPRVTSSCARNFNYEEQEGSSWARDAEPEHVRRRMAEIRNNYEYFRQQKAEAQKSPARNSTLFADDDEEAMVEIFCGGEGSEDGWESDDSPEDPTGSCAE